MLNDKNFINIAKELKALRDSGKRVIAFNDRLSTTSYLMASQASEVWIHPVGSDYLLYDNDTPWGRSYCRTVKIEILTPVSE